MELCGPAGRGPLPTRPFRAVFKTLRAVSGPEGDSGWQAGPL